MYIGQVCGIDDLIAQINLHSRCIATFTCNCKGVYQRTGIKTRGLGGAIEIFTIVLSVRSVVLHLKAHQIIVTSRRNFISSGFHLPG